MRTTARMAAAAILAASIPAGVRAQAAVEPGQRLRVVAPEYGLTSPTAVRVSGVQGDTLVLDLSRSPSPGMAGVELRLPVESVMRLEVSRGRKSATVTGATGLVAGTALGLLVSRAHRRFSASCGERCGRRRDTPRYDDSATPKIVAAGAVIGLAIGVLLPGEEWEPAGGLRPAPSSAARPTVGLSLRF